MLPVDRILNWADNVKIDREGDLCEIFQGKIEPLDWRDAAKKDQL